MIVIGVVGGIASGKSFVTEQLQSHGAVILDADRIGHEVLLRESVKQALREEWGDAVFDSAGEVDRKQLAEIVFDPAEPERLEQLERITHPLIAAQLQQEIDRLANSEGVNVLVLDAPVMVKAGWHVLCDLIVFVEASLEQRLARVVERGWSAEMFHNREAMQAGIDKKRQISKHVIDNNGTLEDAINQVRELWDGIQNRQTFNNPTSVD
ncbi:MAG: dephospho-CoA kinase [Planctomycetaceae bacterium]|nr:dephospho-CoA kinase [Planctomycetaceae bacterium]MCP4462329.1 dephospho-CoA kinase [Planctomycetaceae bacterium]MDG1806592.1 dephospho-CoA kinase [Pirellulaceae bacterium]MDG2103631.1 dephospho-CoA kinase [Pirellulaceae bacterium]